MYNFAYNVLASPHFFSHNQSVSASTISESSPGESISRPKSTTGLRSMTAVEGALAMPEMQNTITSEKSSHSLSEKQAVAFNLSQSASTSSQHPDLSNEVATLSDKLIRAINQQTSLDDTLAQTRQELEASRARIAQLEAEAREHEQRMSKGELMTRIATTNSQLTAELAEERRQKSLVLQEKRSIETELENLTASLFDEANKMVASANKVRDATEKKNQQLRDQIKDGETLIASQSEQLAELKALMQSIGSDNSIDATGSPQISVSPSTTAATREDQNIARLLEAMNLTPTSPETGELSPGPSTSFTHLLKTICRSDIPAYDDFRSLVQLSTRSHHPSRASSGSYRGLNVMGISALSSHQDHTSTQTTHMNTSTTSLNSTSNSHSKSNSINSPMLPGFNSPAPTTDNASSQPRGPIPLKDTKFYKRILVEDVEPTLRLDLSPTISWLNRRSILNALADSSLIVEPIPEASRKLYGKYTPCALCGEARKEEENPRTHWMRMNEGEGATKWALCLLCLEKVRGVGDLVGYVRMVRDGVVKCQDGTEEAEAWEELIKLRERLFWARMAGGVVPAFIPTPVLKSSAAENDDGADKSGFATPVGGGADDDDDNNNNRVWRDSQSLNGDSDDEAKREQHEATLQLQRGLDDAALTTFDNIKDIDVNAFKAKVQSEPSTPVRPGHKMRQSLGGNPFPRITIPRMMPDTFWKGEVNVLR
jgi:Rab guanine nucleotide exchange factor SEC2